MIPHDTPVASLVVYADELLNRCRRLMDELANRGELPKFVAALQLLREVTALRRQCIREAYHG